MSKRLFAAMFLAFLFCLPAGAGAESNPYPELPYRELIFEPGLIAAPHSASISVSARRCGSMPAAVSQDSTATGASRNPAANELRNCLRGWLNPARATRKNASEVTPGTTGSGRRSSRTTAESTLGTG